MNAIMSATKRAEREAKKQQILSPKDLPTFSGQAHEDANDFIGQFESCAQAHDWDEILKLKHLVSKVVFNQERP